MKKYLLLLFTVASFFAATAQTAADAPLNKRLHEYFELNKRLAFEKIMDYTHPKLFTIAPKEDILKTFEQTFNNEAMQMGIDSMRVVTIGPAFQHNAASYKKVDYFMTMHLLFKDTTVFKEGFTDVMINNLKTGFPTKEVRFDAATKKFIIRGNDILFAIKDSASAEWLFLGSNSNPQLIKAIYPAEVIAHFKLL